MHLKGTLLGKQLHAFNPDVTCSEDDLQKYFSNFSRLGVLKCISKEASNLFLSGESIVLYNDEVPITDELLQSVTDKAIRYSLKESLTIPTNKSFEYLLRLCHKRSQDELGIREPLEIMTILAYRQFQFQEDKFNLFARYNYIYSHLWRELDLDNPINLEKEIENIIGIPYKLALIYTQMILTSDDGCFFIYSDELLKKANEKSVFTINSKTFSTFVAWCSGSYEKLIKHSDEVNPFALYPIINSKTTPELGRGELFFMVSSGLMYQRVTSSIYFELIKKFNKGGKNNEFKMKFGNVFQEYVGRLLKEHFDTWEIVPEIKYKKSKAIHQDSVDWFLLKEDKLIVIEVKQSSIFLQSKKYAHLTNIHDDLKKTVIKAASQIRTTIEDVRSKKYKELSKFSAVREIQSLVVLGDPLYNANNLVKDLIKDECTDVDFQIINIGDLERLLANQKDGETLFDVLSYKRLKYPETDFKEYIIEMYPNGNKTNGFLKKYYFELFDPFKG